MTFSPRSSPPRTGLLPCFWLLLTLTALFSPPPSARAADDAHEITVAAYNVENFFDVFDDPYTDDEKTAVKSRPQIESIARAIRAINPDIISFAELESEGSLRAMASEMLADLNYKYIAVDKTNSERGINLGIMSRKPILSMTSHRFLELRLPGETGTWSFGRDLWQVRVQITEKQAVDFLIVHLKSRIDSESDPTSAKWRLAEATEVRKHVAATLQANPQAQIIVMGDFNDTPETPTLQGLIGGSTPLLEDMHAGVPAEKRITYLHKPYRSTIDYILASPAMGKRLVPGSADILSDDALTGGSDHAPVFAKFKFAD